MSANRHIYIGVRTGNGELSALNPWGGRLEVQNDTFEGSVYFAHKPPKESSIDWSHYKHRFEKGSNNTWNFELQIQGRFKVQPAANPCLRCELREGPMKLGLVSRTCCRVVLKRVQMEGAKRGVDLRYSFGEERGERPSIDIPLLAFDRIFISDRPTALPLGGSETNGTWRVQEDGSLLPIDRSSITMNTSTYYTCEMGTCFLDLSAWSVVNLPGIGVLSLEMFWGNQSGWMAIIDGPQDKPRYHYEMNFHSRPRTDESPEAKQPEPPPVVQQPAPAEEKEEEDFDAEAEADENSHDDREDDDELDRESYCSDAFTSPTVSRHVETHVRGTAAARERSESPDPSESNSTLMAREIERPNVIHLRNRLTSDQDDGTDDNRGSAPTLPWYFESSAGELWWCVAFRGRISWRKHEQILGLCEALAPHVRFQAGHTVQDLERTRRHMEHLLQLAHTGGAHGMMDEFTHQEVALASLLSDTLVASVGGLIKAWVGVVECEGRIVERHLRLCDVLQWRCHDPLESMQRRLSNVPVQMPVQAPKLAFPDIQIPLFAQVCVDISVADVEDVALVKASALRVTTPQKQFMFAFASAAAADAFKTAFIGCRTARLAPSLQVAPTPLWRDVLQRWPKQRLVLNDFEPCVVITNDPVSLSARLLRRAISAQGKPREATHALTRESCALKCVVLSGLSPQDLWCFWVNVFHCLLVHAQVACGAPRNPRQIMNFFNNCSYLVAGHIFSLVEIEHCILRYNMTKPKVRFLKLFVRILRRGDDDLENRPCLAAPYCPAAAFQCRADWRLNLVLSAGTQSCSDSVPILESCSEEEFELIIQQAMIRMLACQATSGNNTNLTRISNFAATIPEAPSTALAQLHHRANELLNSMAVFSLPERIKALRESTALAAPAAGSATPPPPSAANEALATPALPPWAAAARSLETMRGSLASQFFPAGLSSATKSASRSPRSTSPGTSGTATPPKSSPSELPYVLYRFRDDAPQDGVGGSHERRWARVLEPFGFQAQEGVAYCRQYNWTMREHVLPLPCASDDEQAGACSLDADSLPRPAVLSYETEL